MNVYLLKHKTEPRFKIGKANNVHSRISSLGLTNSIDYDKSFVISCNLESDSYKLEGILHFCFNEYNLKMPVADGYTEWFDYDVIDESVDLVEKIAKRKGYRIDDCASYLKNFKRSAIHDKECGGHDKIYEKEVQNSLIDIVRGDRFASLQGSCLKILVTIFAYCREEKTSLDFISYKTGLSVSQVKRGIVYLVKNEYILKFKIGRKNNYIII